MLPLQLTKQSDSYIQIQTTKGKLKPVFGLGSLTVTEDTGMPFCQHIKEQSSTSTMRPLCIHTIIPQQHVRLYDAKRGSLLPSYMALKPCALTAKSVVNQSVRRDPVLTMEEGSWNPDSLDLGERENRQKNLQFKQKRVKISPTLVGEASLLTFIDNIVFL